METSHTLLLDGYQPVKVIAVRDKKEGRFSVFELWANERIGDGIVTRVNYDPSNPLLLTRFRVTARPRPELKEEGDNFYRFFVTSLGSCTMEEIPVPEDYLNGNWEKECLKANKLQELWEHAQRDPSSLLPGSRAQKWAIQKRAEARRKLGLPD